MIGSGDLTALTSCVLGVREMTPDECIKGMAARIAREYNPVKIILFGSHARGAAGPESDIDLPVVLPEVANKRQAAVAIRRIVGDLPTPKDIVVTTPRGNRPSWRPRRHCPAARSPRGEGALCAGMSTRQGCDAGCAMPRKV